MWLLGNVGNWLVKERKYVRLLGKVGNGYSEGT
jgi:hypothetical protein